MNDYPQRDLQPDSGGDGHGYLYRECTSFAAWRATQHGYTPEYWGNAVTWPAFARSAGLLVDGNPEVNSLAVLPPRVQGAGDFGHVAWVTFVGSGSFSVEDYNWLDTWSYLEHGISTRGVVFIHLPAAPVVNPQPIPGGQPESQQEDGMGASFVLPDNSQQARFWIDPANGHIFEMWYVSSTGKWNGPADVTAGYFHGQALAAGGLSASVTPDGKAQLLFWRGQDGHQYESWFVDGKWNGPVPLAGT